MSIPTPIWILTSTLLMTACSMVEKQYELAERDIVFQHFDRAISTLNELSRTAPQNLKTQRLLARAFRARGERALKQRRCALAFADFESAQTRFQKVLKLNYQLTEHCFRTQKKPLPHRLKLRLYALGDARTEMVYARFRQAIDENERPKAELLGRTLLTRNALRIDDLKWLAQQASRSKEWSSARYWFAQLSAREPTNIYYLTRTATLSQKVDDHVLADRYFRRVVSLSPNNRIILSAWRKSCVHLGDEQCVKNIDLRNRTAPDQRQLRPLLKSRR